MIPFDKLTYRGQFRRLRHLALKALDSYELGDFSLKAIQHRENTTFLLKTRTRKYLLRVIRPRYKDPSAIRSELEWLAAITRDTDLVVPEPVANQKGELLTVTSIPGVPEPRICALFGWVEGRFRKQADLAEQDLEKVGRLMGNLHRHSEGFVPSAGFARMKWDYEGLYCGGLGSTIENARELLTGEWQDILDQAGECARKAMCQTGETSSDFGLIHADLHQGNYVFSRGVARAIDFDDCGWGYYLSDISTSLGGLVNRSDFPALRAAFLRGYETVRHLGPENRSLLTSFLIADRLRVAVWMSGRSDNPKLRDGAVNFVRDRMHQVRTMLKWPPST